MDGSIVLEFLDLIIVEEEEEDVLDFGDLLFLFWFFEMYF